MLYDLWLQVVRERRNETAIYDLVSGERWSFTRLASAVEAVSETETRIAYPQGCALEFVLSVLAAWKRGRVVCPLEAGQHAHAIDANQLPAHCVHLKLTSATTGTARLIAFTAAQLKADVDNIATTMGLKREWPNLAVISLAHSYGFSNLILPLALYGIPLILAHSPLPEVIRSASGIVPEITLPGVPALWRAWHEAGAIVPGVRLAISAGAPLPLALEEEIFARCGTKIHNFYGSSECGGIAYDRSAVPRHAAHCVGAPMDNVAVAVSGEGCLEVRGCSVGETYWPESSASLRHGCYRTSDLAEISDGLIFLKGRLNDLINVAGRKVSPESIERVLNNHPAVKDCLVFGAPSHDEQRTEIIIACIAAEANVSGEDLKQYLLSRLPAWQVPRDWWFVDSLEVNQRGKLSRAQWRQRYLER